MSFSVTYRRLFEIQVMHEFMLTNDKGDLFFAQAPEEQEEVLNKILRFGRYNIRNYLELLPTESCQTLMLNHKMRFVPTATGGYVGILVTDEPNSLTPLLAPSSETKLSFILRIKHPRFWTITQARFNSTSRFQYFFTNENMGGAKTYPFLSQPIAEFQAGQSYEMGELAKVGGTIQMARQETSNNLAGDWLDLGIEGYVSESDRFLLPQIFAYSFQDPAGINSASFSLRDGADVIKEIEFENITQPNRSFRLDFSQRPDPSDSLVQLPIEAGMFQLHIETNLGPLAVQEVYLNDELYETGHFAGIEFQLDAGDPDFDLLDSGQVKDPYPVFYLRIKNRLSHIRYNKKGVFSSAEQLAVEDFLTPNAEQDQLLTINPRSLNEGATIFEDTDTTLMLPAPSLDFLSKESGSLYADVFISAFNPLIKET